MTSPQMIENQNALDQYIDLLGDEGVEFIVDIIDTFLEDAPNNWRQIQESMAAKDHVTFRRASHTLKTGCATVGATTLSEKFLAMEKAGAANNILSVQSLMDRCKVELTLLARELVSKKKSLQS